VAKKAIKEFEIMKIKNKIKKAESIKERCAVCGEIIHAFIIDGSLGFVPLGQRIVEYKNIKVLHDGKHVCDNCYNTRNCIFVHNHRSDGEKLGIEDIESIKVRFEQHKTKRYSTYFRKSLVNMIFEMKCYIKLKSLKNIGRHKNTFGSENEISINDEFTPYCLPSYDEFYYRMIKHADRAKLESKQKVVRNEKLIKYIYDCMTKTLEIGVDKKIFGL